MDEVYHRTNLRVLERRFYTDCYSHLESKHNILLYEFEHGYSVVHTENTPGDSDSKLYMSNSKVFESILL